MYKVKLTIVISENDVTKFNGFTW